jgi:hypothetical protein
MAACRRTRLLAWVPVQARPIEKTAAVRGEAAVAGWAAGGCSWPQAERLAAERADRSFVHTRVGEQDQHDEGRPRSQPVRCEAARSLPGLHGSSLLLVSAVRFRYELARAHAGVLLCTQSLPCVSMGVMCGEGSIYIWSEPPTWMTCFQASLVGCC